MRYIVEHIGPLMYDEKKKKDSNFFEKWGRLQDSLLSREEGPK